MLYEANIYQMDVEGHVFWIADSKILKGCTGQGESSDEAVKELEENEKEWIATAKECGIPIPKTTVKKTKNYSGKVSLRTSPYVHEKASEAAREQGISLNQFINDAIIKYTGEVFSSSRVLPPSNERVDTTCKIFQFPSPVSTPYSDVKEELEEM